MPISADELLRAKDAAQALLDRLGLSAYVFEVEPHDGQWGVCVECAVDEGWQRSTLAVDKGLLLASPHDAAVRDRLLAEWGEHLEACRREDPPSAG